MFLYKQTRNPSLNDTQGLKLLELKKKKKFLHVAYIVTLATPILDPRLIGRHFIDLSELVELSDL